MKTLFFDRETLFKSAEENQTVIVTLTHTVIDPQEIIGRRQGVMCGHDLKKEVY